jgi:hypothetical protein
METEKPKLSAEELAADVLAYIESHDHVTFAELARKWPDEFTGGDLALLVHPDYPNMLLWSGVTEKGVAALDFVRPKTDLIPTVLLTYLIDGATLKLPIAKSARKYKKPHWVPSVLRPKGAAKRGPKPAPGATSR